MGGGLLAALPRGDLDEASWRRRHQLLLAALASSTVAPAAVGVLSGAAPVVVGIAAALPLLAALIGRVLPARRAGLAAVTAGAALVCLALVVLSGGAPVAWSSFFVALGALALYEHWVPPTALLATGALAQPLAASPTGAAVQLAALLLASGAVLALLAQHERDRVRRDHREATVALLLDLARRHAGLPARQLDILRDLAASEPDPWVFGELTRLDVLAARQWRDAESLLVLSGRRADREPGAPVGLRDVVRGAVAEIEHRDRVAVALDDRLRLVDRAVPDVTHLLAELLENATRSSPPDTVVQVSARPHGWRTGAHQLVLADVGAGMPDDALAAANRALAGEVDTAAVAGTGVGLRVVARLAARHRVEVSLRPGSPRGLAAVVVLPGEVLAPGAPTAAPAPAPAPVAAPAPAPEVRPDVPEPVRPAPRAAPSPPTLPTVVPPPPAAPAPPVDARSEPVTAPLPIAVPEAEPEPAAQPPEPAPEVRRHALVHPDVVPPPRRADEDGSEDPDGTDEGDIDAEDAQDVVIPVQVRRSTPLVRPPTVPAPPEPS